MHPTNRDRRALIGALVLLSLAVGGAALHGQEPALPPRPVAPGAARPVGSAILLPIGTSQSLGMSTNKPIKTARLSAEGVIDTPRPQVDDARKVILTGIATGRVRLVLVDVDNKEESFEIIVQLDVSVLRRLLAEHVPTANVHVGPIMNRSVILSGWVAKAEDVDKIMRIAQAVVGSAATVINSMEVGGVQQVQLDVTIASVSRTEARRRGFAFAYDGNQISFGSFMGGLATHSGALLDPAGGVGARPAFAPFGPTNAPNAVFGIVPANVQLLMEALRNESVAKVLAEPKLIAMSGRPAHFLVGGQQAILSASGGLGGPGVSFREVGTEVDFLPIVLGNGRIYLEVFPVVRAVNNGRGLNSAFGFVPGFDEQSVRTAVELEPGQTMAIGGLIQTTTQATSSKVPVLGDLPFLGTLFSSVSHSEEESELVILVTPHLIDGQDCRQVTKRLPGRETRSPDDYELFLESLLEAPRGQRQVFVEGKYKAAYKNDPTLERFPCADPLPKEPRPSRRGSNAALEYCPPAAAQPARPASAAPGVGAYDQRVIPPTWVEPASAPARYNGSSSRAVPAPVIPAPAYEEPPR